MPTTGGDTIYSPQPPGGAANVALLNAANAFTGFPQTIGTPTTTDTSAMVMVGQQAGLKCLVIQHKIGESGYLLDIQEFHGGSMIHVNIDGALYAPSVNDTAIYCDNQNAIYRGDGILLFNTGAMLRFGNGHNGSIDSGVARNAAGIVEINNGTAGGAGSGKLNGYTVATLPGTPAIGMYAVVTDALVPVIGNTVVAGGAAKAFVWYNGANWTVMGK